MRPSGRRFAPLGILVSWLGTLAAAAPGQACRHRTRAGGRRLGERRRRRARAAASGPGQRQGLVAASLDPGGSRRSLPTRAAWRLRSRSGPEPGSTSPRSTGRCSAKRPRPGNSLRRSMRRYSRTRRSAARPRSAAPCAPPALVRPLDRPQRPARAQRLLHRWLPAARRGPPSPGCGRPPSGLRRASTSRSRTWRCGRSASPPLRRPGCGPRAWRHRAPGRPAPAIPRSTHRAASR